MSFSGGDNAAELRARLLGHPYRVCVCTSMCVCVRLPQGFSHCATIASYYELSETLNHIAVSLCKYTLKCVEAVEEMGHLPVSPVAALPYAGAGSGVPGASAPADGTSVDGTSTSSTQSLLLKRALITMRCTLSLTIGRCLRPCLRGGHCLCIAMFSVVL